MTQAARQAPDRRGRLGPGAETVIVARGLRKAFGDGRFVGVASADLAIRAGEFVSLVDPSGCRTSTLLRMVAERTDSFSGHLDVHDREAARSQGSVAVMFQKPTLLVWRTVVENVLLPTEIAGRVTEAHRKAMDLLALVGLREFAFAFPSQLPGGPAAARRPGAAAAADGRRRPALDEPFGALNEFTRERLNVELMRIVAEVATKTLFITPTSARPSSWPTGCS